MNTLQRDLALHEPWQKSLERSHRRRELAARARKEVARRKGAAGVMATAMMAGPAAPFAFAAEAGSTKSGGDATAPADAGSGKQIEIRAGGLPLKFGLEGDMVAALQKGVGVDSDGIFGPITESAVKAFQARHGLPVTGVVDPTTWQALFSGTAAQGTASSSSADTGPAVDLEASRAAERAVPAPKTTPAVNVAAAAKPHIRNASAPAKPAKAKPKPKPSFEPRHRAVEAPAPKRERRAAPKKRNSAPERVHTKPVVDRSPAPGGACGSRLSKPLKHYVQSSPFGPRGGRMHEGMDLAAPSGTAIHAAACGVISFRGQQSGYGNMICIKHTSRFSTCYAHMSRFAGITGRVRAGQVIGYVGCTGNCTGPHLHFETRIGGQARNPAPYLRGARYAGGASVKRASVTRAPVHRSGLRRATRKRTYHATNASRWSGSNTATATAASGSSTWKQAPAAAPTPAPAPAAAPRATVTPVQPAPAAQPAPVQPKATVTPQAAPQAPQTAAPQTAAPATPAPAAPQTAPEPAASQPAPAPVQPKPAATDPAPTPEPEAPVAPKAETPAVKAPETQAPQSEANQPEAPTTPQASKPEAPASSGPAAGAPAQQAPAAPAAAQAPAPQPAAPATPAGPTTP